MGAVVGGGVGLAAGAVVTAVAAQEERDAARARCFAGMRDGMTFAASREREYREAGAGERLRLETERSYRAGLARGWDEGAQAQFKAMNMRAKGKSLH